VKAKNMQRNNLVRLCVDDQIPLYSFVTIAGIAEIISNADQKNFSYGLKLLLQDRWVMIK
jgi:hypothetical protein